MKNFDMGSPAPGFCVERFGIDSHSGTNLLRSFRDDPVPGIEPIRNHPAAVHLCPHFNWSNFDLVVVIHYGNLVAAL